VILVSAAFDPPDESYLADTLSTANHAYLSEESGRGHPKDTRTKENLGLIIDYSRDFVNERSILRLVTVATSNAHLDQVTRLASPGHTSPIASCKLAPLPWQHRVPQGTLLKAGMHVRPCLRVPFRSPSLGAWKTRGAYAVYGRDSCKNIASCNSGWKCSLGGLGTLSFACTWPTRQAHQLWLADR
jgi:hypothetical protein